MMAGRTGAEGTGTQDWLGDWTVFYWAWWLSWDALRGHVHRPDLAADAPPAVRRPPACCGPQRREPAVGSASSAARHRPPGRRARPASADGLEAQLFDTLGALPLGTIAGGW